MKSFRTPVPSNLAIYRIAPTFTRHINPRYFSSINTATKRATPTKSFTSYFSSCPPKMAPNEVDRTIHPHTTGAAADTAAAHQAEKPLKLYAGWFCPFVQRTWITLNEKKIDYQYIEINPYHKDPEFLKLNPRGLVPTLGVPVPAPTTSVNTNGNSNDTDTMNNPTKKDRKLKPIYESIVIAEYLDEHYSDTTAHGPRLLPSGDDSLAAYERARCRLWIDHISSRIVPAFYRFLQHTPEKDDSYTIQDARDELLKQTKVFTQQLLELDAEREELGLAAGPWFLGEQFSLVDITLIPWALRLFLIDHYKPGGVGIPEKGNGGEDEEVWGRWRTWYEKVQERDSVMCTMSERSKYIEVYQRYAEDKTGSQVGQATRGGRSMP